MDLGLRAHLAKDYTSAAQRARIVTEDWAARCLYCPNCPSPRLGRHAAGRAVTDFRCPRCEQEFQLKSKSSPFGSTVNNSAYGKKLEAMRLGTVPNYVFIRYDRESWTVRDGFMVPRHFIVPSVIAARRPLRPTADRAGWIGSTIRLSMVPPDGRVSFIEGTAPRDPADVRKQWARFRYLMAESVETRGWTADVLGAIRSLGVASFHLRDLYAQAERLARLHPGNRHVEAKIRQQVERLRDRGILEALGKGNYHVRG